MKKLHLFLVLALALTLAGTAMAQEISASAADNSPYDTIPATGLTSEVSSDTTRDTSSNPSGSSHSKCLRVSQCGRSSTNLTLSPEKGAIDPADGTSGNNGGNTNNNGGSSGGRRGGVGGNTDEGTPIDLSNLLNYLGVVIHPQSVLLATPAVGATVVSDVVVTENSEVATTTATSTSESNQLAAAIGTLANLSGWSWFWAVVILVVILGLAIYLVRRPSQQ